MPQQVPWSAWMTQQAQSLAPRTEIEVPSVEDIPSLTQEQIDAGVMSGQLDPLQTVRLVEKSPETEKRIESIKARGPMSQVPVPYELRMKDLMQQAQDQTNEALMTQKQGITQLEENINQIRKEPKGGIDYTPFISFAKMHDPSLDTQSAMAAATSLKPESPEQKAERLLKLQSMLATHKEAFTKAQLDNLKERIQAAKNEKVDPLEIELKMSRVRANNALAGIKADGKLLPEISVQKISDFDSSLKELRDMEGNISSYASAMGPVRGRLGAVNPYNIKAQEFQADLDRARQVIGKAVEGGVLRKEDEEKYKKMLPSLSDTPETALYKMQQFNNKMSEQRNNYLGNMKKAGFNTKTISPVQKAPSAKEIRQSDSPAKDLNSMTNEELEMHIRELENQ